MTEQDADEDTVRCWLVERTFHDEDLADLVYATPDGRRYVRKHRSAGHLARSPATAAIEVPESDLDPVEDEQRRERYESEAQRVADRREPDEEL